MNFNNDILSTWVFPDIETERLVLRTMTLDDAPALLTFLSDDEVTRYMDIDALTAIHEAEEVIQFMNDLSKKHAAHRWGIYEKETGQLIGTCGFNSWVRDRGWRSEIGYDLARPYWGLGLMPEALTEMISFGFREMNLNRIEAMVLPGNDQSMSVLNKLGFQHEGLLRDHGYWSGSFWDEHMFSLLKRDWENR